MDVQAKPALRFKDKILSRCRHPCRPVGHYHCHLCERTVIRRVDMERHLLLCDISSTMKPTPPAPSAVLISPQATPSAVLTPSQAASSPVLNPPAPAPSPVLNPLPAAPSPVLNQLPAAPSPVLNPPSSAASSSVVSPPPPPAPTLVLSPPTPAAPTLVLSPPTPAAPTLVLSLPTPAIPSSAPSAAPSLVLSLPPSAPSPVLIPPPTASSSVSSPLSSGVDHAYAVSSLPAAADVNAKSLQCPHCGLSLLRKNLKIHMLRKHANVAQETAQACHLLSVNVDEANGISAVQRSEHEIEITIEGTQSKKIKLLVSMREETD